MEVWAFWLAIFSAALAGFLGVLRLVEFIQQRRQKVAIICEAVVRGTPMWVEADGSSKGGETYFDVEVKIINTSVRPITLLDCVVKVGNQVLDSDSRIGAHGKRLGEGESFILPLSGYGLKETLKAVFEDLEKAKFKIIYRTATGERSKQFRFKSIAGWEKLVN